MNITESAIPFRHRMRTASPAEWLTAMERLMGDRLPGGVGPNQFQAPEHMSKDALGDLHYAWALFKSALGEVSR